MKHAYRKVLALAFGAMLTSQAWAFGGFSLDLGKVTEVVKSAGEATKETSEAEEIALGEDTAAIMLATAPLVRNDALQRYVNQLGRYLSLQTERPDLPWHFGVLDSPSINAFATPGGHIFITNGLLMKMHNEAELAGVLGHEIGHVLRKHHLAAMKKKGGVNLLKNVVGIYADQKTSGVERQIAEGVINVGKGLFISGLDKEDEYEADRIGAVVATRAGYDPYGLAAVLQMLGSLPRNGDVSLLFSTHPAPADRIGALDGLMQTSLDHYQGQMVTDRFVHMMARGKK